MTEKFMCKNCLRSTFALSNPHVCPHCGGDMQGVRPEFVPTDVPGTLSLKMEETVDQYMRDLIEWHQQGRDGD